jgi:RNA polymerase sigma-70 factor (ECF subfamily)
MTVSAELSPIAEMSAVGVPNEERFGALHGKYCDGIWRYLRRVGLTPAEADDATQHVFLVVSQRLVTIRLGSERAFLYEVASRVAADVRRRAARRYEGPAPSEHIEAVATRPDDLLEERDRLSTLDTILSEMSPEHRQVFALFEIEELSMKEIARILKTPPGTVASRLRRAREEFRHKAARHRKGNAP